MKKVFIILAIAIIFLVGIKIGGNFTRGSNNLFEESKDQFEHDITQPGNNYKPSVLAPEEGFTNKIAHAIDQILESIIGKVLSRGE